MKISIIGHGNVGGALAKAWAGSGHEIVIGARSPEDDKVISLTDSSERISATSISESIQGTDVIVIAIPAHLTADLAGDLGDLKGRIVIDTTNSVFRKPEPYQTGFEAFQKVSGARVAKCFNSTGAENMSDPVYPGGIKADMFVAGDDEEAKSVAKTLAEDAGFECYDFGGDAQVPLLEEMCRVWINLAMSQGMGRDIAFKLLRR